MSFNSIPELRGLPWREQSQLWRRACLKLFTETRTWLPMAAVLIAAVVAERIAGKLVSTIILSLGLATLFAVVQEWARPYIREQLRK
jgi:hypothetical protein